MEVPKAIVLGSDVNALSIIRALGRKGLFVVAVGHLQRTIASYSKYVKEFVLAPDPHEDEDGFRDFLLSETSRWTGAILIPTGDFQVDVLSKHYAELSRYYVVSVANRSAIETIQNKHRAHEFASRLNIPTPKTFFPQSPEHISELANSISYPCILKPMESHKFKERYPIKLIEIDSPARLCSEYARFYTQYPMMIQEIIEGDDSNIVLYAAYYDLAGEPLAEFTGRKVRQNPPYFGSARVAESIHNPEIVTFSRVMLKKLNYGNSLVGVEFKCDDRDNILKFIEINARSVKWYSLIEASGMNLPWIMYQDLVLGRKIRQSSHKVNVFWIHITADIRDIVRRPKHEKSNIKDYLSPYFSKKTFAVFDRHDLKPAIRDWYVFSASFFPFLFRVCGFLIRRAGQLLFFFVKRTEN